MDARARVLATISDKLRLINDEFQFNLLVRKAVELVEFTEREEAVLRRAARRSTSGGVARSNPAPSVNEVAAASRAAALNAVVQAELGLIALALRHPELRSELKVHLHAHSFPDAEIGLLLEEICVVAESSTSLEATVSSRLDEQRRGWLSGMMVDSLIDDAGKARALMADFLAALNESQRRRHVAELRRAATTAHGEEAVAAAQAIIVARRRAAHQ